MTLMERFWSKVDRSDVDGCWLWTGYRDKDGYGTWGITRDRCVRAHRISLGDALGRPLKAHEQSLHKCDNPPCVRPSHLYVGTPLSNAHDRDERGRHAPQSGESNPSAKLSIHQVLEIRRRVSAGQTQTSLASEFGVSNTAIYCIAKRLTWSHL
jgi:hypothetical protein